MHASKVHCIVPGRIRYEEGVEGGEGGGGGDGEEEEEGLLCESSLRKSGLI